MDSHICPTSQVGRYSVHVVVVDQRGGLRVLWDFKRYLPCHLFSGIRVWYAVECVVAEIWRRRVLIYSPVARGEFKVVRVANVEVILVKICHGHIENEIRISWVRRAYWKSTPELTACCHGIDLDGDANCTCTSAWRVLRCIACHAASGRDQNEWADKQQWQRVFERRFDIAFHHPSYWIHILSPRVLPCSRLHCHLLLFLRENDDAPY